MSDEVISTGSEASVSLRGSRPSAAKAVLRVALVLGLTAAIVGCSGSNDDEIAAIEAERDAALAQVEKAEGERDALAAELEAQEAESAEIIEGLASELDDALAANDELTAELAAETERADAAEAALLAITGAFPVAIDASLIPEDMPGTYAVSFAEAYCDGFATCGSPPAGTEAIISTTPEGFLRVAVPGILDAGLFALDGSLYAITDSFTALPQCNGVDQRARVTLTLYADDVTITAEATRRVDSVGASITIDTPYTGPECPNGLVFYSSSFVPVG